MSTGSPFGFSQSVAAMSDDAEHDWAIESGPAAVLIILHQADRLADQCLADVDGGALPFDVPVVADSSDRIRTGVVPLAQDAVPAPWGGCVVLERRVVAEALVRTLLVVEPLEALEAIDLLAQRACRWIGRVLQQRQVQPLQPAVLLRLAGRDPLRQHARFDDLDRQPRQPAGAAPGKPSSVGGAQVLGPSELTEGLVQ